MEIIDYFTFEPIGRRIEDLETPVPIIDIEIIDRNLKRWQEHCNTTGIANRPHIKTHKLVALAKYQMDLGAKGITVQKLGEAEVMADAGISDMLLTFNVIGTHKVERLASLARRTAIKVVSDNAPVVEAVAEAGKQAGRDIAVLVECDTGAGRNGVQTPEAARQLAREITNRQGVAFGGLMTFPRPGGRAEADAFLAEALELLHQDGIDVPTVSSGGTPDMWKTEGLQRVSEYRVGTYIYNDRSLVARGTFSEDECALHVLATVVSAPTEGRAVLDSGSKSLTSDLLGLEGYGTLAGYAGSLVKSLSEEHGVVDVSKVNDRPRIGDLVRVLPNHVCPVVNLFDRVVFVKGDEVLGAVKVDARGLVQ